MLKNRIHSIQYADIYLICICVLFMLINISFHLITLDFIKYQILSIGLIVLLILLITQLILRITSKKRAFVISVNWIEIIFSLFVGWIFVTGVMKGISINAIFNPINMLVSILILLIIIRKIANHYDENFIKRLLITGIFILGIYQSIFGILQYFFDKDNLGIYKTLVTGSIIYPNSYGLFMVISLSCLMVLFKDTKKLKSKIALGCICPLFLFVIFANLSRGTIFSGCMSLCIVCYLSWIRTKSKQGISKTKIWGIAVLLLITLFCFFFFLYYLNEESSSGRLMIMKIVHPMLEHNFLTGVGYNHFNYEFLNYQEIFFQNENNVEWAHKATESGTTNNQFLKCFLELGVIGGCIFAILWFTVLYKAYNVSIQNDFKYGDWFLFVILTLFFHCFIDETFQSLVIVFMFLYVVALIPSKLFTLHIRSDIITYSSVLAIIIFGLFIIQNTVKIYQNSRAYKYERLANSSLSHAQYEIALNSCNIALSIDSESLICKSILGRTLIAQSTYEHNILKDKYLIEGTKLLEDVRCKYHNRDLYLALSYGYLKMKNYHKSFQYAQKVHRMFPMQLRPILLLGILDYSQNKPMEAKEYIMDCINKSEGYNRTNMLQINRVANSLLQEFKDPDFCFLLTPELILSIDSILIAH